MGKWPYYGKMEKPSKVKGRPTDASFCGPNKNSIIQDYDRKFASNSGRSKRKG